METILGVKIDNLNRKEILDEITGFLNDGKFHQIATVGPEFVLKAQKNEEFKNILNGCDLNVADGFGIKCAFWRFGKHLKTRLTGVDLTLEMLRMAEDRELGVFLACRKDGLSDFEETKTSILKIYPRLKINGGDLECHSRVGGNLVSKTHLDSLDSHFHGNDSQILFCNFGAPYQEIFLNSLKNDIIGVAMGVGGTFDFLTGKVRRAPKLFQKLGLEWFWRLIQQPKRWRRIWNASVVFPIKVILNKKI
jgi:N-acetylglucosaminyldiphosphoundecaprenol N-acetyl-beta-D-mannosaminyltransferase